MAVELQQHGFNVLALHGDLEPSDRRDILVQFSNKSISVLVATDVAARGLDINKIDAIINYDIARDPEVYLHRIGRTGRAGSKGKAFSIYTSRENHQIKVLEENLNQSIKEDELPPISVLKKPVHYASMVTLQINGGKSQKVRPGDVVGALTGEHGIKGVEIGDIDMLDRRSYVAGNKEVADIAFKKLSDGGLKGRSFRGRRI